MATVVLNMSANWARIDRFDPFIVRSCRPFATHDSQYHQDNTTSFPFRLMARRTAEGAVEWRKPSAPNGTWRRQEQAIVARICLDRHGEVRVLTAVNCRQCCRGVPSCRSALPLSAFQDARALSSLLRPLISNLGNGVAQRGKKVLRDCNEAVSPGCWHRHAVDLLADTVALWCTASCKSANELTAVNIRRCNLPRLKRGMRQRKR
ncbi:hypothetical protein D3C72_1212810 [compost metagenome]